MEQLFLYYALGSESRQHLDWHLIAMPEPEGPFHLEYMLKIQLVKLQAQISLVCSMMCHIVQQHVVCEIPKRQETLFSHIQYSYSTENFNCHR